MLFCSRGMPLTALSLLVLAAVTPPSTAETCFQIRGRAVLSRADGFFAIWHVGTDHRFFLEDEKSSDLVCTYFDCTSTDQSPALFADFTVCPTKPYVRGAAQPVIVKKVEHPRVVQDWDTKSNH